MFLVTNTPSVSKEASTLVRSTFLLNSFSVGLAEPSAIGLSESLGEPGVSHPVITSEQGVPGRTATRTVQVGEGYQPLERQLLAKAKLFDVQKGSSDCND
jgi:hypothetical protein